MKKLFYILISVIFFAACSEEADIRNNKVINEGDEVTLNFSVAMPEEQMLQTRAFGENTNGTAQSTLNLWLFVYDSEGIFVQAKKATRGDTAPHEDHYDTEFSVTLNATKSRRIIHFIAYDGGENEGVGALINNLSNQFGTESSMLSQLYTTNSQAAYWHRLTVDEIVEDDKSTTNVDESTKFICVPLVRNFAKIIVNNRATGFTLNSFTVVNAPTKGTVAPYSNGSFIEYVNGTTNKTYAALSGAPYNYTGFAPIGMTATDYITAERNSTTPFYLYETPNAAGNAKGRTTVIINGTKTGQSAAYYKVDLVYPSSNAAEGNLFYNILRNFAYTITINEVLGAGYPNFNAAINGAAGNNLSASTATSNLSAVSDGKQKLEVTNTYFCFTASGPQLVLKYRYSYLNNSNQWVYNNNLVDFTSSNNTLFSTTPAKNTNNDATGEYTGWRTITLNLNSPGQEAQTSLFHIYASQTLINRAGLSSVITGELLSRDVRIDLRQLYPLLVDCPTYVKKETGTAFTVNLLIPQGINDKLFPMDFLIEPASKTIYPDASSSTKLPVHIGQSIVEGNNENSFQYVRTVTAAEYANFGTKTVGGVTYKVVPCEFKTNIAESATTVYASNKYFSSTPEAFDNKKIFFTDESNLTIEGTQNYGLGWDVKLHFSVTADAVNKNFNISITEGSTTTDNITFSPTTAGEQTHTYQTKTFGESAVSATITATGNTDQPTENKTATANVARRYFFIKANSFTTNIITIGSTDDKSSIFVGDYGAGYVGNGYGEEPYDGSDENNYLTANGLLKDYRIDVNYATKPEGVTENLVITESSVVKFVLYDTSHKNWWATTTAGALDRARRGESIAPLVFVAP